MARIHRELRMRYRSAGLGIDLVAFIVRGVIAIIVIAALIRIGLPWTINTLWKGMHENSLLTLSLKENSHD